MSTSSLHHPHSIFLVNYHFTMLPISPCPSPLVRVASCRHRNSHTGIAYSAAGCVVAAGPEDPSLSSSEVLPRGRMPEALCSDMVKGLSNVYMASNPARIVTCGQVITVFREDLLMRMRRNAVVPPNDDAETLNEVGCPICHTLALRRSWLNLCA